MEWMACYLSWYPVCGTPSLGDFATFLVLIAVLILLAGFSSVLEYGEDSWFYKFMMPKEDDNNEN
jgi:hypothetical protein